MSPTAEPAPTVEPPPTTGTPAPDGRPVRSRTTPTRHPERATRDRDVLHAVLDAGLVGHLGLVRDGAPVVLPVGYARRGDVLYVHGSSGAGWLRAADGAPVCLTVTHLDGIVYARSVFAHSMNYRSAVVHATARRVTDPDEVTAGLRATVEQLSPGSWDHARRPDRRELAATGVLALDLDEAGVKVRTGPPGDHAADDETGLRWAGELPLHTVFGPPRPAPDLPADRRVPTHVADRRG